MVLILTLTFLMLNRASSRLSTYCYEIGVKECNKYVTKLVSDTLDKTIDEEEFNVSVIKNISDSYKEFNTIYLQSILKDVSNCLIDSLDVNENSYIISKIPISLMFDNALISTIGPDIPISYKMVGDVIVDMKYNVSSFGYNNALIELLLNFEFEVLLYIPLQALTEKILIDIPIYSSLIEGDVPSIAFGSHDLF